MKTLVPGLIALSLLTACHDHDHPHGDGASHSHSEEAQTFSGASYEEGEGLTLLPPTRQALGIRTAPVEERKLTRRIRWVARFYDYPTGRTAPVAEAPRALAAGTVPAQDAGDLQRGADVHLTSASGQALRGRIVEIHQSLTSSEMEVVTQIEDADWNLPAGAFLQAEATFAMQPTMAVPKEAVIRGVKEDYVFVVNGDAYLRTCVETGVESEGFIQIQEGLKIGDSVVTWGALDLWLIELRAVKGGQGCCPAPPAKGEK